QSKRQMQRIEEHYNELKNQLRSFQNTKNKLAKSQPYKVITRWRKKICASEKIADTLWKDIRNIEYMSHCIREWSKDFLEQGTLPRHQQEKHAKRKLLLDDKDLKLAACIWLCSIPPKDCFPLALKKELETNIFPKLLEVPIIISESTTRKFMHLWGFHKKTVEQQVYFNRHEWKDVREYRKG
ncbi:45311_t:CDS:2, partial [Gigaspora margarita]